MRSLHQERAEFAWQCVHRVPEGTLKEYGSVVKGLSARVMISGLGPVLAYLAARADRKEYWLAYRHLEEWLTRSGGPLATAVPNEGPWKALRRLQECDVLVYRQAATEALALLEWLRSLADARLGGG